MVILIYEKDGHCQWGRAEPGETSHTVCDLKAKRARQRLALQGCPASFLREILPSTFVTVLQVEKSEGQVKQVFKMSQFKSIDMASSFHHKELSTKTDRVALIHETQICHTIKEEG